MDNVLIISDPHFHGFKAFSHQTRDGGHFRLGLIRDAFHEALDIGVEEDCKCLVIPGDIFHVRGQVRPSVANVVHECLRAATNSSMEVVIIPGNHDMENYRKGDTAVDIFNSMEGVTILSDPRDSCLVGDGYIMGIPYIHDVEEFKREFEEASGVDDKIILIHQGVDNFRPGPGMPETGITAEWLQSKTDAWVIAGHYHKPKMEGRVISPGSMVPHNFGDTGKRGCVVLKDSGPEFHPLSHPEFVTIDAKNKTDLNGIDISNAFVRFRVPSEMMAKAAGRIAEEQKCPGWQIYIEREFETAHTSSISLDTPEKMLDQYIGLNPRYSTHREALLGLYADIVK